MPPHRGTLPAMAKRKPAADAAPAATADPPPPAEGYTVLARRYRLRLRRAVPLDARALRTNVP